MYFRVIKKVSIDNIILSPNICYDTERVGIENYRYLRTLGIAKKMNEKTFFQNGKPIQEKNAKAEDKSIVKNSKKKNK